MSTFSGLPDAERTRLRALVSRMDREVERRAEPVLHETWADLVRLLALGPEPEVRNCPSCGRSGMRAATRCGYCWVSLAPVAPPA